MIRSIFKKKKRRAELHASPDEALRAQLPDSTPFERELIQTTRHTTMTSPERLIAFTRAVEYVERCGVGGDIVECGVWRGGSMFAAAKTLAAHQRFDRKLWLYDTFEGMTQPGNQDVDFMGQTAEELLRRDAPEDPHGVWCLGPQEQVRKHLGQSGYPEHQIQYVVGQVELTLPSARPDRIAILRLDTDWYESTRCELTWLFPLLAKGGVLIVDDYGHWQGCQRAVDEYFAEQQISIFLNRIDYTGRIAVKQ
jgi:hypothetical protein